MTLRTKDTSKNLDLLSEINKHPFDSRIKFQEEGHKYWIDDDSTDLISATTFIHSFFPEFDGESVVNKIISSYKYKKDKDYKYYGMTKEEILESWELNRSEAAEAGTLLHADIEYFYNGLDYSNNSPEFEQFLTFFEDHSGLEMYRTEWMIFSEILRITGSIDAVFRNEDNTLTLGDWKRSKEITYSGFNNESAFYPFQHLQHCNYDTYSLQLNLYRIILERFYKEKIKEMFLVVLHPNNENNTYQKINVPIMEKEAQLLLDFRVNQLITLGYPVERFSCLDLEYRVKDVKKEEENELEEIEEEVAPRKRLLTSCKK